MAKTLSTTIQTQITNKRIGTTFTFTVNSIDFSAYLLAWSVSYDKSFGSASAIFTLNNNDNRFGEAGANKLNIGDVVSFIENYEGDTTNWKKFYGVIEQRSISKNANERNIKINCLDYISVLQNLDIDLLVEGTKVTVTNETLTPVYLPAPNDNLAQVFNFANSAISDNPAPIVMIRDTVHSTNDPQYDGFEIYYDNGQLRMGSPINALNNYSILIRSYDFYVKGVYAEDILEQILTQVDGYGSYLFGETSAANVITNHLTTTFHTEEDKDIDVMSPNYTSSSITIETTLTVAIVAGDTSITMTSTSGFPATGSGSVCGDIFTWTSKDATHLYGIPATGTNALKAHANSSYVKYTTTYAAGRVWYLTYSNLTTDLVAGNFTVPVGRTVDYVDKRYGRIILDTAVSTASYVICNVDYTFKTLQATGIEINRISFRPREVDNRLEAINKLRSYLAPNYTIRTQGDNKIFASYLSQKVTADYTLALMQSLDYMEDEDLYTRVKFYGKNKNPINVMFTDDVGFVTTGETYKGLASNSSLTYLRDEGNYYVFGSSISSAGYIDLEEIVPIVYIDNVPIDSKIHRMVGMPVVIDMNTKSVIKSGCHGYSKENYTKVTSYYYYTIRLAHTNIETGQPIYLYNAVGSLVLTIGADDINMSYKDGVYKVPSSEQNSIIESISTATYWVLYSDNALIIDYDNVEFKIRKNLIIDIEKVSISATYEYWAVFTPVEEIGTIIDGRWDTQVQTEFFAEVPAGYNYAIIDLGATKPIQAIDIVAGFYKPDDIRKFDINFKFSLHYSINGVDYYLISDKTYNMNMTGGGSVSLEDDELGSDFQARYLKIVLENVKKIDYNDGVWVVAFSEFSAYTDIVVESEATLIPTTALNGATVGGETIIIVDSTSKFSTSGTAYIGSDAFTYSGVTATSFTGCASVVAALNNTRVSQTIESDTTLYDDDGLLAKLGDRLYKEVKVDDKILYTSTELDYVAIRYLEEFYKNHSKLKIPVIYSPFLQVGQTVHIDDTDNNTSANYFIESIEEDNGFYELIVAKYP